jgi:hypothetical protein
MEENTGKIKQRTTQTELPPSGNEAQNTQIRVDYVRFVATLPTKPFPRDVLDPISSHLPATVNSGPAAVAKTIDSRNIHAPLEQMRSGS